MEKNPRKDNSCEKHQREDKSYTNQSRKDISKTMIFVSTMYIIKCTINE